MDDDDVYVPTGGSCTQVKLINIMIVALYTQVESEGIRELEPRLDSAGRGCPSLAVGGSLRAYKVFGTS